MTNAELDNKIFKEREQLIEENGKLRSINAELLEALREAKDFVSGELCLQRESFLPGPTQEEAEEIEQTEEILEQCLAAIARAEGQ